MKKIIRLTESDLRKLICENVKRLLNTCILNEATEKPTEEEYYYAIEHLYDADNSAERYAYLYDIIERFEEDDRIYDKLEMLSIHQTGDDIRKKRNSEFICTNGKIVNLRYHDSVKDIGFNVSDLLSRGFIRIIGGYYSNYVCIELAKYPNKSQEKTLSNYISTCNGEVYVDITDNRNVKKQFVFDRNTFSVELILRNIKKYFQGDIIKEGWMKNAAFGAALGLSSLLPNASYAQNTQNAQQSQYNDSVQTMKNDSLTIGDLQKLFPKAYEDRNANADVWEKNQSLYTAKLPNGKYSLVGKIAASHGQNPWKALVDKYVPKQTDNVFDLSDFDI